MTQRKTHNESEQKPKAITPTPPACDMEVKLNRQKMAIDALAAGESVTNAAKMAGIRRETLSRWLNGNPVFIAKLNQKKNEQRHESITSINTMVTACATALKTALSHPDINPTAVVQSVMSMLPKMYTALLAQGEAETDPINVFLKMEAREAFTRADFMKFPTDTADLEKRMKCYEKAMAFDQAIDDSSVSEETLKALHLEAKEACTGLKGTQYSMTRESREKHGI